MNGLEFLLPQAVIRSWQPQDVPVIVRHANSRRVWRNMKDRFPHPYTTSDAEQWIHAAIQAMPQTHFAIANPGEAIGGIGLDLQTDVFHIR